MGSVRIPSLRTTRLSCRERGDLLDSLGEHFVFMASKICLFQDFPLSSQNAVLIILDDEFFFHDGFLDPLAFLTTVADAFLLLATSVAELLVAHAGVVIHREGVGLGAVPAELGDRSSFLLVLHHSDDLLIHPR